MIDFFLIEFLNNNILFVIYTFSIRCKKIKKYDIMFLGDISETLY